MSKLKEAARAVGLALAGRAAYNKVKRDFAREVVKEQRRGNWRGELAAGVALILVLAIFVGIGYFLMT